MTGRFRGGVRGRSSDQSGMTSLMNIHESSPTILGKKRSRPAAGGVRTADVNRDINCNVCNVRRLVGHFFFSPIIDMSLSLLEAQHANVMG